MNGRIFLVLMFVTVCSSTSYSQRQKLPYLKDVDVHCSTIYKQSEGMFYYTYEIENGTVSEGNILDFRIDISRSENEISYDTVGLKFRDDGFTEGAFRRHYPALAGQIIPVGFPLIPKMWVGSLSDDFTAAFGGDSRKWIKPGTSLGGFVLMSKGCPGIRRVTASPRFFPWQYFADPDEYPDSAVNLDSVRFLISYHGWTIGPTAPPSDFSASSWVDTLVSYKDKCITLGWLADDKSHKQDCDDMMKGRDWYKRGEFGKFRSWEPDESWEFDHDWNSGIVRVLDMRLDKAKRELSRGDSVKARRDLEILVIEVEMLNNLSKRLEGRDKNPIMTSEAYALLKYNAEYLIDRLPERHGRHEEGQGRSKK